MGFASWLSSPEPQPKPAPSIGAQIADKLRHAKDWVKSKFSRKKDASASAEAQDGKANAVVQWFKALVQEKERLVIFVAIAVFLALAFASLGEAEIRRGWTAVRSLSASLLGVSLLAGAAVLAISLVLVFVEQWRAASASQSSPATKKKSSSSSVDSASSGTTFLDKIPRPTVRQLELAAVAAAAAAAGYGVYTSCWAHSTGYY